MKNALFIEPGRIGDYVLSMGSVIEFLSKKQIRPIWVAREELRELIIEQLGEDAWGGGIPSRFRLIDIPNFLIKMIRLRRIGIHSMCVMSPGKSARLAQIAFPKAIRRGYIDTYDIRRCLGVDGVWRNYDVTKDHLSQRATFVLHPKDTHSCTKEEKKCGEFYSFLRPMVEPAKRIEMILCAKDVTVKSFILFSIGARWSFRRWPLNYWAELARSLTRDGHTVVLCGPPSEQEELNVIHKAANSIKCLLLPTLSIPEFVELARTSKCMVTLDSGPMHIAAAVKTPCVALYGPSDPALTLGCAEQSSMMCVARWEGCPFWPCIDPSNSNDGGGCRQGEHSCMKNLSVDVVHDAIKRSLFMGC